MTQMHTPHQQDVQIVIPFALDGKSYQCEVSAYHLNTDTGLSNQERLYITHLSDHQDAVNTLARVLTFFQQDFADLPGDEDRQTHVQAKIVYKRTTAQGFEWVQERVTSDGQVSRIQDLEG